MNIKRLLAKAPIEWQKAVDRMSRSERNDAARAFEGIAKRAAMLAGYLDERHGYGCGDQGHDKGVETANENAQKVWCKVFGYNAYHEIRF